MTDFAELVGRNLGRGRESRGLSKGELARRMGVDRRVITRWESGAHVPQRANLQRLALILNVPLSYFLSDGDELGASDGDEPGV